MNTIQKTRNIWVWILPALGLIIALAAPSSAATISEIVAMDEVGVPPEIIIEVIEATGIDDPLDDTAWMYLLDSEIDPAVLEYMLVVYFVGADDETDEDSEASPESVPPDHPNLMGGEGFHHEPTGYNPLYGRQNDDGYRPGPTWYQDRYNSNRSVVVYEPPVYVWYDNPGYYYGYQSQGFYRYSPRYWNDGYTYYDRDYSPYYYVYPGCGDGYRSRYDYWDDYYRGRGWHGRGSWYYDGRRHRWDSSLDAWFNGDDFRFRISF